jgi:hypothetical protein
MSAPTLQPKAARTPPSGPPPKAPLTTDGDGDGDGDGGANLFGANLEGADLKGAGLS